MEFDEFVEPQVAVAVAATAALLSPRVRRVLRRGTVYGLAGGMLAVDAISSFGRGVAAGVHDTASSAADAAQGATDRQPAGEPAEGPA
jgi:hypothetical protein